MISRARSATAIAAVLVCAALTSGAPAEPRVGHEVAPKQNEPARGVDHGGKRQPPNNSPHPFLVSIVRGPADEAEARDNQTDRQRQYKAQLWNVGVTVVLAFFALVQVGVGLLTLQGLRHNRIGAAAATAAAEAATKQAELARQAHEAEMRPWVGIEGCRVESIAHEGRSIVALVTFTVRNFGRTPALELKFAPHFVGEKSSDKMRLLQQEMFSAGTFEDGGDTGAVLFPGEVRECQMSLATPIAHHTPRAVEDSHAAYIFTLAGFVRYQIAAGQDPKRGRLTSFMYRVSAKGDRAISWRNHSRPWREEELQVIPDLSGGMAD